MSSRGVRLADSLTNEDVNEIADAEAGKAAEVVNKLKREAVKAEEKAKETVLVRKAPDAVDGKVTLEGSKRLKDTMQ